MNNTSPLPATSEEVINPAERKRIASGVRLTVALMAMVALIVTSLTLMIFVLVTQIFDSMEPATAADLSWKARRGAIELSKTAELGLVTHDQDLVRRVAADYLGSNEVVNVIALDSQDVAFFKHGSDSARVAEVFSLEPLRVHSLGDRLVAWAPASIEEQPVGKVLVAVSRSRLEAGSQLRRQILTAAVAGGLLAMFMAALFVAFYIAPILRLTQQAFVRLEHTTHAALEAARLKAQFLANMSHEIRTPMNAVVGLAKLMLGMPLGPKVRRYAEMIDASSRALLNIINDILDFSKIEAGKYEIVNAEAEPATLVQEVAELLADRAQVKGIDLVYRVSPEAPRVAALDADRVRQILTNLVGNAVKFTERGEVYIQLLATARADGQTDLRFEVHDSGVGVPQEFRDHVFEAFSQADGSLVRKHGGTGLGLAISKQLVRLMDGQIGLESEPGKGSCFWFSIPARVVDASSAVRAQPTSLGKRALIVCDNVHAATGIREHVTAWGMEARVAAHAAEAKDQLREAMEVGPVFDIIVVSETHSGTRGHEAVAELRAVGGRSCPPVVVLLQQASNATRSEIDQEIAAQLAQPVRMSELYECLSRILAPSSVRPERHVTRGAQRARSFAGAKILVVDDNEMNQFVAVEQLARLGCTTDQAFNGKEALEKVSANEYALVLMDCQMPVMDGYTATREIRAREAASEHKRRTVIVALTAHALQGERERVLEAGMDDYLTKPVRPATLQRTLERWMFRDSAPQTVVSEAQYEAVLMDPPEPENDVEPALEDCATQLLKLMLEKVPEQLELLDGAIALQEPAEVREHAHKLKGSLLTVSAPQLAKQAENLQRMAESQQLEGAEDIYAILLAGYRDLERMVRQELSRRARAEKGASLG